MRTHRNKDAGYVLLLLSLAVAVTAATAGPAMGLPAECTEITAADDSDGDGFPNSDMTISVYGSIQGEDGAIALPAGLYGASSVDYASDGTTSVATDGAVPDLFAIVNTAAASADGMGSYFPEDILSYTEASTAYNGLALDVHYLSRDTGVTSSRDITTCQKAITLTEDDTAYVAPGKKETLILGITTGGDPNYLDSTTVYSRRIVGFVDDICGGYMANANCVSSTGAHGADLIDLFVKYVANHEVGHTIMLADVPPSYVEQYSGQHFPPDELVMLSQQATYTKKGSKVTFHLTDAFHPGDQAARVLHTYSP